MVYRGHVQNGVVQFDGAVHLPDGTVVEIQPVGASRMIADRPGRTTEIEWKEARARIKNLDIDWDAYRHQREFDCQHMLDHEL
jgi:hypothetical protein